MNIPVLSKPAHVRGAGWPAISVYQRTHHRLVTVARRAAATRRDLTDAGTATAEYAIATLAACGFAGVLLAVMRSGEVKNLLTGIIRRALSLG